MDISKKFGQKSGSECTGILKHFEVVLECRFRGLVALKTGNQGDLNDFFKQIACSKEF